MGTTCYSLGVEEEEKAYHGEFTVELDLIKEDLYKSLSVKEDEGIEIEKQIVSFDFSPYLVDFKPTYYKKPKAVPTPEEDRTRTSMQKEVFLGEATLEDKVVGYKEALEVVASWIKGSESPHYSPWSSCLLGLWRKGASRKGKGRKGAYRKGRKVQRQSSTRLQAKAKKV